MNTKLEKYPILKSSEVLVNFILAERSLVNGIRSDEFWGAFSCIALSLRKWVRKKRNAGFEKYKYFLINNSNNFHL